MSSFEFGYSHIVAYFLWGFFVGCEVGDFELGVVGVAIFEFLDLDDFFANDGVLHFHLHKFIFAINLLLGKDKQ